MQLLDARDGSQIRLRQMRILRNCGINVAESQIIAVSVDITRRTVVQEDENAGKGGIGASLNPRCVSSNGRFHVSLLHGRIPLLLYGAQLLRFLVLLPEGVSTIGIEFVRPQKHSLGVIEFSGEKKSMTIHVKILGLLPSKHEESLCCLFCEGETLRSFQKNDPVFQSFHITRIGFQIVVQCGHCLGIGATPLLGDHSSTSSNPQIDPDVVLVAGFLQTCVRQRFLQKNECSFDWQVMLFVRTNHML